MTEEQLQQLRHERWRLNGNPIRTIEDARSLLAQNGFCLMYPLRPPLLVPTFIGAFLGSEENLPNAIQAASDERAQQAQELMVRLLREKSIYEANVFGHTSFLLSAEVFPYFYALAGSRTPKQPPKGNLGSSVSPLVADAFVALQKHGPMNKEKLGQVLGGALSETALDRALNELWLELRITRVDYVAGEGAYWDVLYRWSPKVVNDGVRISIPEAVSALISQYLQCVVAAELSEIENFLNVLVPKTRVKETVKALLAGRELEQIVVGTRQLLLLVGEVIPESPAEPVVAEAPKSFDKWLGNERRPEARGGREQRGGRGFADRRPESHPRPDRQGDGQRRSAPWQNRQMDAQSSPLPPAETTSFEQNVSAPLQQTDPISKPIAARPAAAGKRTFQSKPFQSKTFSPRKPRPFSGTSRPPRSGEQSERREDRSGPTSGEKRWTKPGGFGDRARGPRTGGAFGAKPFRSKSASFDKPRSYSSDSRPPRSEERPERRDRPASAAGEKRWSKPSGAGDRARGPKPGGSFGAKPFRPKSASFGKPRSFSSSSRPPRSDDRPERGDRRASASGEKRWSKPSSAGDRARGPRPGGSFGAKPFRPKSSSFGKPRSFSSSSRPPRADDRPERGDRRASASGEKRWSKPSGAGERARGPKPGGSFGSKPFRSKSSSFDKPRSYSSDSRPPRSEERPERRDRPASASGEKRWSKPSGFGDRARGPKPGGSFGSKPFRPKSSSFGKPRSEGTHGSERRGGKFQGSGRGPAKYGSARGGFEAKPRTGRGPVGKTRYAKPGAPPVRKDRNKRKDETEG